MGRRISGAATTSAPVASIAHNPRNARDDYADIEELQDSIQQYGILQPIGVVRYEVFLAKWPEYEQELQSAHWVAMQGNRRLAAARAVGLTEVPVTVQEQLGRTDRLDESILIENVHRKDLPPLREAALLQELVDKHGSQTAVAKVLAKSVGWVNQRLSLLKLLPELQDKLSRGELTVEQARDLSRIPRSRQAEAFDAGPPFRDPAKTENAKVSPAAPAPDPEPKPTSSPAGEKAFYGVKADPAEAEPPTTTSTPAAVVEPSPPTVVGEGNGHSDQLVTVLRHRPPHELALAIKEAYTADQLEHLSKLLLDQL